VKNAFIKEFEEINYFVKVVKTEF